MAGQIYVGLMSGTSLDGVDAVVAEFDRHGTPRMLARASEHFTPDLRQELLALNSSGVDELARASIASQILLNII